MDKHTLKANAIAACQAINGLDWSKVVLRAEQNKCEHNSVAYKLYQNAYDLVDIQVETEMKKCFDNLTEYYK